MTDLLVYFADSSIITATWFAVNAHVPNNALLEKEAVKLPAGM
jgi:hypothetical protein